ncbi:uncharacterized protein EI90DRAFT_3071680, partial [Cantharellus anzutake]|uniref:uncharacterized protein n=1 Tax=Cantharellus anzutake TaxID=1750568 RepID=UPI001907C682
EKGLYHHDKDQYSRIARQGGKGLYFAKSGTENETWVPLLEKAYAKLHGDYSSLNGGQSGEAAEDLTGGVSSKIHVNDILDIDWFWTHELMRVNEDRLFSCSIYNLQKVGVEPPSETISAHAYSILKAVEYRGKRFLRIRNPWGDSEWTGRWADGSKEWTSEWLNALGVLGHEFGDDGAFIMEYEDFLETWTMVHRTKLFDPTWIVSSLWIKTFVRPPLSAWDFGDVSFTFTLPSSSAVVIVLSQLDKRYFEAVAGMYHWSLDFRLYKKGSSDLLATSSHSTFYSRSVNTELTLEGGEYVVHVRAGRFETGRPKDYVASRCPSWNIRKFSSVMSKAAISESIASSDCLSVKDHILPRPVELFAGRDLHEIEIDSHARLTAKRKASEPPLRTPLPNGAANIYSLNVPFGPEPMPSGFVEPGSEPVIVNGPDSEPATPVVPSTGSETFEVPAASPIINRVIHDEYAPPMTTTPPGVPDLKLTLDLDSPTGRTADSKRQNSTPRTAIKPATPDSAVAPPTRKNLCHRKVLKFTKDSYVTDVGYVAHTVERRSNSIRSTPETQMNPIVGARYKCLEISCPNYDLCSNCKTENIHFSGTHTMLMVPSPKDAVLLETYVEVSSHHYSKMECPSTIRGQLRHGQ